MKYTIYTILALKGMFTNFTWGSTESSPAHRSIWFTGNPSFFSHLVAANVDVVVLVQNGPLVTVTRCDWTDP